MCHIIVNISNVINSIAVFFRFIIGDIFFMIEVIIAQNINKNSNVSCVMIHHNSQYLGIVYIQINIHIATHIEFIINNTFCLSVATNR